MALLDLTVGMWIWMIIGILALIFVVVEFVDMIKSKKLKKDTKLILVILFIVASLLTAIVYYIWKRL